MGDRLGPPSAVSKLIFFLFFYFSINFFFDILSQIKLLVFFVGVGDWGLSGNLGGFIYLFLFI